MPVPGVWLRATKTLVSLFYPPHCASCGSDTPSGIHLCAECALTIRRIDSPFCERCSQPFEGEITQTFVCPNCAERNVHFECAVAPYRSTGVVREFVHQFKYGRHLPLRFQLADWMMDGLADHRLANRRIDALVPVPLHHVRLREREFNQAEMLARQLSKRTKIPVWKALKRVRYTNTQTRLDRTERMENLRGAFEVRKTDKVRDCHLILIDDVFTTGSTVEECSRVLRESGAASVRVLTVARG